MTQNRMVRLIAANDVDVGAFAGGRAQYAPRVDHG